MADMLARMMAMDALVNGGGGSGTDNYNLLENKPSINSVQLKGNKTGADLGLAGADTTYSKEEVDNMIPTVEHITSEDIDNL